MNPERYQPWIDWMKVLGMAVIIFGHTGGHENIPPILHPFNPKQIGVAFFIFVAGYTLATERRRAAHAVFSRFFEVFVLGLLAAFVMSIIMLITIGDINESNYLPFILGVNVLFDYFPANPTTWYIGCYFHILVAWALIFRKLKPTGLTIVTVVLIELLMRTAVLSLGRNYTAYMLLSNWLLVFLMGQWMGSWHASRQASSAATSDITPKIFPAYSPQTNAAIVLVCLFLFAVAWWQVIVWLGITTTNPFGRIPLSTNFISALATSCSVTFLYLVYTMGIYVAVQVLPNLKVVGFLAKNTIFIFIAHLPLIYAISPWLYQYVPQGWGRVLLSQFLYFFGLALVSSVVVKAIRLKQLKLIVDRRLFPELDNGLTS